jgi:ATP-dependent phosphofructokinase / diphosphate-dependent phosphofructokinase
MKSSIRRIGVLSGGGDAPGLNAVIRAVVKTAKHVYGWTVLGIEDGFEGLLGTPSVRPLGLDDVRGLLPRGGSILGCTNRGHFGVSLVAGAPVKNEAVYAEAVRNIKELELDALVVLGGEGSQRIAYELSLMGVSVVGAPKTIDNDLSATDLTFGFDSALVIATEAIDRLHTTAESHDRVVLVEVMGRHVGWIALMAGIAGGADVILIPELPFSIEKVARKIREREAAGRSFSILAVAEGARPEGGELVYREAGDVGHAARLGGIAEQVAAGLSRETGKESRVVVLGHVQRGGSPTPVDRLLASCFGSAAVHALAEGKLSHMVAWKGDSVVPVPLARAVERIKRVPLDHYLVRTARDLGISFASEGD